MEKKLQVFISSTYTDLMDERQAAVQAILNAGHIPAGMELFKAGNRTQLETILKWIDDSDVYMLILGGRYGSIEPESCKSYIQVEYEYALNKGIPIFSVVLSDKYIMKKGNVDNHNEYVEFKELVMSKIVKIVDDEKDIKLAILETLHEFINDDAITLNGWVRENSTSINTQLYEENKELQKINNEYKSKIEMLENKINDDTVNFEKSLAFEGDNIVLIGHYSTKESVNSGYHNRVYYKKHSVEEVMTWDELFLLIAPYLYEYQEVDSFYHSDLSHILRDRLGKSDSVYLDEELYRTILLQYLGLGLICNDVKTSSQGKQYQFIRLTAKGKNYLMQQRTIKK
mgnify:CR=1 FL=1